MFDPPLKPGQVLDKTSEYAKTWPGRPALFRLSNTVLLQIPPQYQQFWYQGDKVTRAPADLSKLPSGGQIGFEFFMPNFSGYTPENYQDEFHEDIVRVIHVKAVGMGAEKPGASGYYPPNIFEWMTSIPRYIEPDQVQERFGLRCYPNPPASKERQECFGLSLRGADEHIALWLMNPLHQSGINYPHMQAVYFSTKYGGIEVIWRTHIKNFSRWQDIDSQIWKFIDAWNISEQPNSGNKPK